MEKKLSDITSLTSIPEYLLGGLVDEEKFVLFPKSLLVELINSRKSSIKLTGLTGTIINHADLVGRSVTSICIDDVMKNTGFVKGGGGSLASSQLILQFDADFQLEENNVITIFLG